MTASTRTLSVVVPCHDEEACIPLFLRALAEAADAIAQSSPGTAVELVLVDDGSRDRTAVLCRGAADDAAAGMWPFVVRWLSLSRNFGKEGALLAGIDVAMGDLVAVMDADLQDPPSLLPRMLAMLDADPELDCVATRRSTRDGEPPVRSWCSRLFYRLMNAMSPVEVPDGARDFRMMRRPMADAVAALPERNRFSKGLYAWVGFRTAWIDYPNVRRAAGRSAWSFLSLSRYALDGLSSCSTLPLTIASYAGVLLCAVSFVATGFIVVRAALFGDPVPGWPSLACLITFIGGLQLLCLGVIGRYLAKTYVEAKHRPAYIVRDSNVGAPARGVDGRRAS